jgi:hypothetical protein
MPDGGRINPTPKMNHEDHEGHEEKQDLGPQSSAFLCSAAQMMANRNIPTG